MQFAQAPIEVQNRAVVGEIERVIKSALGTQADGFLYLVKRFGLKVRQFEEVLKERIFDQLPEVGPSRPSEEMYGELSASDQGVIREFYLTRIEEVPVELRAKYAKLYRYQ
jgi:hypothetical protein